MPNIDALVGVREWARDQHKLALDGLPSEWDQMAWLSRETSCGTVCCIAGKAVLDAGAVPVWWEEDSDTADVVDVHGVERTVEELAREVLDLTLSQAARLFFMFNEFKEVERIINKIIADSQHD